MKGKIISLSRDKLIESLYLGAEDSVSDDNIISLNFGSADRVANLMDDIEALLADPADLHIVEPILREALQHIAARLLQK